MNGLTPVPSDDELERWLQDQIDESDKMLYVVLEDLKSSIEDKRQNGEPINFSYGKLLNFLASEYFTEPDRIRLLATALWELAKDE